MVCTNANPADFIWDTTTQKLTILKWGKDKANYHIKITPGIRNF